MTGPYGIAKPAFQPEIVKLIEFSDVFGDTRKGVLNTRDLLAEKKDDNLDIIVFMVASSTGK